MGGIWRGHRSGNMANGISQMACNFLSLVTLSDRILSIGPCLFIALRISGDSSTILIFGW